jgi:lysophospholipase L1-like esterase
MNRSTAATKSFRFLKTRALFVLILLLAGVLRADNSAVIPAVRTDLTNWMALHENYVAEAKKGGIDLLFVGDSITERWRQNGKEVWRQFYAPRHAANFGISGDRTQHVLWRLEHGELDGIKPKVVVLLIGTNNTRTGKNGKAPNTPPQIIEGVTAVVDCLRTNLPESRILLLAIFPRGHTDAPERKPIAEVNRSIAGLDDGKQVKFLDIGGSFLEPDGTLSTNIMPDLLHLSPRGYQIWANAMEPTLAGMLGEQADSGVKGPPALPGQ